MHFAVPHPKMPDWVVTPNPADLTTRKRRVAVKQLRSLMRCIATAHHLIAVEEIGATPPSPDDVAALEAHPEKTRIDEMASQIWNNDLEDAFASFFAHALREDIERREHNEAILSAINDLDLPQLDAVVRNLLAVANEEIETRHDPATAIEHVRDALRQVSLPDEETTRKIKAMSLVILEDEATEQGNDATAMAILIQDKAAKRGK